MKPTDFKNDQVLLQRLRRSAGRPWRRSRNFRAPKWCRRSSASAALAGSARWISAGCSPGRSPARPPSIGTYTQEISGSSTPRDLETALQLNYLAFTAPNFTPETLDLLKRRLGAVLENQAQNPKAVFGEKVSLVNTSEPLLAPG